MLGLNKIQKGLDFLQPLPLIGPVVLVAKGLVSVVQIISGLAVGILCGATASACRLIKAGGAAKMFSATAADAFTELGRGVSHLFYASLSVLIVVAVGGAIALGISHAVGIIAIPTQILG